MFKSPRRNGRNKGVKIKHVIQISLLLGVSIWLLYQIHNSDDTKSSVNTVISRKSGNDSSRDIVRLGRKVLRPKVKRTKEHHHHHQADDEQNNDKEESESVVDEVGDNEHTDEKEDGENIEKDNDLDSHEESGKIQRIQSEEINEQNNVVTMDDNGNKSNPNLREDDNDEGEGEDETVKGEVKNETGEEDRSSSKRPNAGQDERKIKKQTAQQKISAPDSYAYEINTANNAKLNGNEENMKAESEMKDDVLMLEEEKDAFTDVETVQDGTLPLKRQLQIRPL